MPGCHYSGYLVTYGPQITKILASPIDSMPGGNTPSALVSISVHQKLNLHARRHVFLLLFQLSADATIS